VQSTHHRAIAERCSEGPDDSRVADNAQRECCGLPDRIHARDGALLLQILRQTLVWIVEGLDQRRRTVWASRNLPSPSAAFQRVRGSASRMATSKIATSAGSRWSANGSAA
jgi:hypothetical protein